MTSLHEMREHIRSIENIGQITRTLQAVSAGRVRIATKMAEDSRDYSKISFSVLAEMLNCEEVRKMERNYYAEHAEIRNALIVFVSADRGLAGNFNMNIFHELLKLEEKLQGVDISYITVGKKGRDMLLRRRRNLIADFSDMDLKTIRDWQLHAMRNIILEEYADHRADEVYIVYTEYRSVSHYYPRTMMVLPLYQSVDRYLQQNQRNVTVDKYIFEGNKKEMLDALVRRMLERTLYRGILAGRASEHSARMLAMSSASENAEELSTNLKLTYAKLRQNMITTDILDINGGAEALQQEAQRLIECEKDIFLGPEQRK